MVARRDVVRLEKETNH